MALNLAAGILMSLVLVLPCAIQANTDAPAVRSGTSGAGPTPPASLNYGNFLRPFAKDSPWNAIPVNPVLDTYVLPQTAYHPFFGTGPYTTGVFESKPGDPNVTVMGLSNPSGVWITDEGVFRNITIPRWPADVVPASGTDGHADIVDTATGLVHSFWQLRKIDGNWRATQYAWTALNGRGWPDPAHNHQGARAAGVPTMAGLIRKHELDDGDVMFRHVLAMTLDGSALRRGYVFPATAEDDNARQNYRGEIPMGSLMMLPSSFDIAALSTPSLRKLAQTLKVYGAAVVDQNHDTRFTIPVEQGAVFDLHPNGWNSDAGNDLTTIASALRRVVSVEAWVDANGKIIDYDRPLNLLSMRGPWINDSGSNSGRFDSWKQHLHFDASPVPRVSQQSPGKSQRVTAWAAWQAGKSYTFSVQAGGGAKLRLQFRQQDNEILWETADLGHGQKIEFEMPAQPGLPLLVATSGIGQASWVKGNLIANHLRSARHCLPESVNCSSTASIRKPRE